MIRQPSVFWLLLALSFMLPVQALEKIVSFDSDIEVRTDGSMLVTERIAVMAEGKRIKRGIYRDFPTLYQGAGGFFVQTGFEVVAVKRDGREEPFHYKPQANGVRLYIGDAKVFLPPGEYHYEIRYITDRQIGFFDDHDELYWNVTGNGWQFAIDSATATVRLPQSVPTSAVHMAGYTGPQGSTARDLSYLRTGDSGFRYQSTRPFGPGEGLTIVLGWPTGIVSPPDSAQRVAYFYRDNRHNVVAIGGLILVLIYYLAVWILVGKDPQKAVVIPRYRAPPGFSPASTRYVDRMGYDKTCFTAALVNLAIKGAVNIAEEGKHFLVSKIDGFSGELAPGEQDILDTLFLESPSVALRQSNHEVIGKAVRRHEASLQNDYEKRFFMTNKRYFIPGILLSLVFIIFAFASISYEEALFATIFVGMMVTIPFVILGLTFRRVLRRGNRLLSLIQLVFQLGFFGVFFAIAGDMLRAVMTEFNLVAWPLIVAVYLMVALNIVFEQWLKAPTLAGSKIMNRIDGLKLYLSVAEADEVALRNKPQMTTDIYEQFLPYAVALGVANQWSEAFDRAIAAGLAVTAGYRPGGLMFPPVSGGYSELSNSLSGSLDSAISAASTAPGSSSGSSGGSSGGGGGGGGGGGW